MRRTSSPTVPAAALLAAGLALSACAGARAPPAEALSFLGVQADGASFRVVYGPADVTQARQVARALGRAAPRAQRFARLSSPVTLTVHPGHDALERAVDRPGFPWLLAWARARTVDLQSPRTWGRGLWRSSGASDAEVEELLVHELTHCAMFQAAGGEVTWVLLDVPRWFEEGMASVAAGQGHRRATLAELRRHWRAQDERHAGLGDGWAPRPSEREPERGREGDPLLDPDPIYRERADLVYGAAHHAFAALVARHGDAAVHEVITRLAAGEGFAQAFQAAVGQRPDAFAEAFRAEVVAGGGEP